MSRRHVGLKDSLDKAHKGLQVRQACISGIVVDNFLHRWHEKLLGFFHVVLHGCCCCFLHQCEVHVVWWIFSHILRWPRSLVLLPSGMRSEACCRSHEVGLRHLGSWYQSYTASLSLVRILCGVIVCLLALLRLLLMINLLQLWYLMSCSTWWSLV